MYNSKVTIERNALPVGHQITLYAARIYRNKLQVSQISCQVAKHPTYSYKYLLPQSDVPTPFKKYLRSWNAPEHFHITFGYDNPDDAIKVLYQDDLTKFTKYYKKYEKAKKIISQTYPHYNF